MPCIDEKRSLTQLSGPPPHHASGSTSPYLAEQESERNDDKDVDLLQIIVDEENINGEDAMKNEEKSY